MGSFDKKKKDNENNRGMGGLKPPRTLGGRGAKGAQTKKSAVRFKTQEENERAPYGRRGRPMARKSH